MINQILIDERYLVQLVGGSLLVHPGCMVGNMFATRPGDEMAIVIGPEWAATLYPLCRNEAEVREIMDRLLWPMRG